MAKVKGISSGVKNAPAYQKVITWIIGSLLVVAVFWDLASPWGIWKLCHLRNEANLAIETNIQLDKQNQMLANKIRQLQSDPTAQAELVRQRLGWVKDNEIVFVFDSRIGRR